MPKRDGLVRGPKIFNHGWTEIEKATDLASRSGISFFIYVMKAGERWQEKSLQEAAWVLLSGRVRVDGTEIERKSLFDEAPTVFHFSKETQIEVAAISDRVEWAVVRTKNDTKFESRLFLPSEVSNEFRGKGWVQGACIRNVRLVFDLNNRPESKLVLGEVINYPGRWSSYPPHHHAQPEIYHYRFTLPQGYGHAELGDEVYKVFSGDTITITDNQDHAQVSAPGYGMYYLWVVRHLDGNPYRGFEFTEEHKWILDPQNQGWRPKDVEL